MKIYMEQIPEGISWNEYPDDTIFIFEEKPSVRDSVTFQLIPPQRRPSITPEDINNADKGIHIPTHKYIALLRNGSKLLCQECQKGFVSTPHDPEISHFFSCDKCVFMINID